MILSLRGRLETRWFLATAVALPWTVALALLLRPGSAAPGSTVRSAAATVAVMALLGSVWELAYHGAQQLRWDRDWPSVLVLASVTAEAGPVWLALGRLPRHWVHRAPGASFLLLLGSAWVLMWLFAQGPMRVLFVRWRINGGRLTCRR
ncbi:MAG TPA: hypothetical protein VHV82_19495 [Sporichthyaceae bacterium]|nr:hypothetical protein [Sporichthyaceae bacterium]